MNFHLIYPGEFRYLANMSRLLMLGVILFAGFVFTIIMINTAYLAGNRSEKFFLPALVIVTIAAVYVARFIYFARIKYIDQDTHNVKGRLEQMKTTVFLHHAVCGIPAIVGSICLLLFGNFIYFLFIISALAEMISKFPTIERVNKAIDILGIKYIK